MIFLPRSSPQPDCPSLRHRPAHHGAALVIVLTFLVLATVLMMAFFGAVSSEFEAAKVGADVEAVRQLAETTVQITMGQIRAATSAANKAWASQPGMIRTYNDSGQSEEVFALYSTAQMQRILGGVPFDPADDLPDASWAEDAALWADLNTPVETRSGDIAFPIIDPRAAATVSTGLPLIEGFSYDTAGMAGAVAPANLEDLDARLPMPVRWIYVLRDGTLTVPLDGSGETASFVAPEPIPTAENPIVGRIAFWTDDETSKLNINTACGGVPWDTPIGNSGLEMLFARYQPAKNEFSRYPGHPATVNLAPALWRYLGLSGPDASLLPTFTPSFHASSSMSSAPMLSPAAAAFRDKILPLVPRNSWGGSQMATRPTVDILTGAGALAAVDGDRLFASADEIIFGPSEGVSGRDGNPLDLRPSDAALLRFFLTAHSRTPELNPFGLPKVSIWPLPDATRKSEANSNAVNGDTRSTVDRLIAFCTSLSYEAGTRKREYAFTRYDATSATNDFFSTDAHGTPNNRIIYDYLEGFLSRPIPGFGGTFTARYGTKGSRQILTNIYDFIRAQINLADTSNSALSPTSAQNLDPRFVSRYAYAANFVGETKTLASDTLDGSFGAVLPARLPNGTRGAGRFPVISQVSLLFIAKAANQPPVPGNPMHPWVGNSVSYPTFSGNQTHPGLRFTTDPDIPGGPTFSTPNANYPATAPALNDYETQVEPGLMVKISFPGAGVPGFRERFRVRLSGLANLRVNGGSIFPSAPQVVNFNPGSQVHQFHVAIIRVTDGIPFIVSAGSDQGQAFPFDGGTITIEILKHADDSVVQTYSLTFPSADFPTPLLTTGAEPAGFPPSNEEQFPPHSLLSVEGRASTQFVLPQWPVTNDFRGKLTADTVRSLEVAFGDARFIAPLATVGGNLFLPHRFYFDSKMRSAHSLRSNLGSSSIDMMPGATLQYLTPSSAGGIGSLPSYGGGWNVSHPEVPSLWDVATGDDVRRLAYSRVGLTGGVASIAANRWPFTASTIEFDPVKWDAYKSSHSSLNSLPDFSSLWLEGGDFTSGLPGIMDGSLIGKVDEGNNRTMTQGIYPYFNALVATSVMPVGPNLFSPNRQVPSPVVLGSIPSGYLPSFDPASPGLDDLIPWRTLLFSPNPVGRNHAALAEVSRGGSVPPPGRAPDFAFLDFFWMPVVEPYALSEPLSTAGKVNMNAQIAPFTYITRTTALRGALRSTLLTAVPDKWLDNKNVSSQDLTTSNVAADGSTVNWANFRYPINANETLKQFQARFEAGDIFRSSSEICSLWLYPDRRSSSDVAGPVWDAASANISSWWYDNSGTESKSVTGDNLREKPYATLYPLLTTKSNTYTVHFKVQALQKISGTPAAEWIEGRDRIASEFQGSQTIERYIDPMDSKLIDFATASDPSAFNLGDFYRFRILSAKRFTP